MWPLPPSFAPIQWSLPNVYLPDKQPFVRAQRNFQILNQIPVSVALNINKHSTDEGHSPEASGHLLQFWHFQ